MADMISTLTFNSDFGDTLNLTGPLHTLQLPKKITQVRKVTTPNARVASGSTTINYGTEDADGPIPERIKLGFTYSVPLYAADNTELDLAVAMFREFVASDQFTQQVEYQRHIPISLWS